MCVIRNQSNDESDMEEIREGEAEDEGLGMPSCADRRIAKSAVWRRTICWLPLGYHPWWSRQINKAIKRMNGDSSLNCLLPMANAVFKKPFVRVAWKNMLPNTDALLQR